jgi:hypothetical protein
MRRPYTNHTTPGGFETRPYEILESLDYLMNSFTASRAV